MTIIKERIMFRCAAAWVLYWIGDGIYWLEDRWFGRREWTSLYRPYSWFMGISERIQGPGENGPWRDWPLDEC